MGSGLKDGDRVVIIEDVTTSGKVYRRDLSDPESRRRNVEIKGLMVSLNRMETWQRDSESALQEIHETVRISCDMR